jgi:hypothetical protein
MAQDSVPCLEMLKRAHQNLCHPSPEQLSTALRNQGVQPEVSSVRKVLETQNSPSKHVEM